jgi:hypothetical protein
MFNSFSFRVKAPIIGINEIMKALVSRGAMDVADYYQHVHKLRASNARFIPLEKGEILHHLLQAKIDKDKIVETRELAVLRRHVALCLLQGDALQRPPMPEGSPNPHGEIAFIIGLARATIDSLKAIWEDKDREENECVVRSGWLLDNLYLDYLGLLAVTKTGAPEMDPRHRTAMGLTALIISAFGIDSRSSEGQPSRRRRYLGWLSDRVIHKRFAADPSLPATVADVMKRQFVSPDEQPEKTRLSAGAIVLRDIFNDLPEPIRAELTRDVDFMTAMGFKSTRIITIDDLTFDGDEFFRAVEGAIKGREATITPLGSGAEVVFCPAEGPREPAAFLFRHPVTGTTISVKNDELALLGDSPSHREAILRRNRHWFDCSNDAFEKAVATIATIGDPRQRIEELEPWRKSSASEFYAKLYQRIGAGDSMNLSELVPSSGDGLLRHYRLSAKLESSQDFKKVLEFAARTLIREEGLEAAITRMVGLPVPLPSAITGAVRALSIQERRLLVKQLLAEHASPISRIHFLHLLLESGDELPAFRRLARRVCRHALSAEAKGELDAFVAVLKWTSDEFELWNDTQGWSHTVRLAMVWAHTHRLISILISRGVPLQPITSIVASGDQRISVRIFRREPEYNHDIANPRHVSPTAFVLAGLSYAIGTRGEHFLWGDLREILKNAAFPTPEIEGIRLPDLQLLLDSSQAQDGLCSFLGGDRGEKLSPLLGTDARCLSRASLKNIAEMALNALAKKEDGVGPWIQLSAVLGDLPPYEDLIDGLKNGIRQTSFVEIFAKDIMEGTYAISAASLQASNIHDDEVCGHLKDQLQKIAVLLAGRSSGETASDAPTSEKQIRRKACFALLDSALKTAVVTGSDEKAVQEFVDIVTQLAQTWPEIVPDIAPIVQRLWEDLPPAYAQSVATLHVLCRSK